MNPARAETLTQAFAAAYRYSPTLDAERARLRAVDETVTIARSGYRPTVSATGILSWDRTIPNNPGTQIVGPGGQITTDGGITRTAAYGLALTQSLFTGFQVYRRVQAAEAQVRASRAVMRNSEQALFISVVNAYTGVLSAHAAITLVEAALKDNTRELKRARQRLALQETTRTDVAQAQALRATTLTDLARVQGELRTSRAVYTEIVGRAPGRLVEPANPRRRLPRNLKSALSIALQENPLIVSALYTEEVARNNVDEARGRLLPQVGLTASHGQSFISDESGSKSTSVSATVTVPIYAGGANHAAVRQAKQLHVGTLQAVAGVRSAIRREVVTSWTRLQVANNRARHINTRISAIRSAIKGIRKEESVGQRTLDDLFRAQRDLITARIDLLTARRDALIASYEVLAAMGRLDPASLLPPKSRIYDPTIHYHEVRRKWFGISISYRDGRTEHLVAKDRHATK